jgi:hypothetical protein
MECADCGAPLSPKATRCRCGWTSESKAQKSHPLGYPQCAWEGDGSRCKYPGSMSSSGGEGAKYFCGSHFTCNDPSLGASIVRESMGYKHESRDIRQLNIEAARFCREKGLESVDQMRAFCKVTMPKIGRKV